MMDSDYLIHYGVLGMKWGVRKNRGGLPGKRKIKKQIKKANKNPDNNKNTINVSKKVNKEFVKSNEYKTMNNSIKILNSLNKAAKARGGQLVLTKSQVEGYNKTVDAAEKKLNEIKKKHIDKYAGAMLKDLGYKDTQAGREYLKKKKLV